MCFQHHPMNLRTSVKCVIPIKRPRQYIPSRYLCVLSNSGVENPPTLPFLSGKLLHPSWDIQLVSLGTHSKMSPFQDCVDRSAWEN